MTIHELTDQFGIDDILSFSEDEGGLVNITITNSLASATISTYSAQVLAYKPNNEAQDLLFVSKNAYYQQGKATKGGIPVCWPWFGPSLVEGGPGHGFVRACQWDVLTTNQNQNGTTVVVLGIKTNIDTQYWPHSCELRLEVTVGESLNIALITENNSSVSLTISQAFHTYFKINSIAKTTVTGLDGKTYIDKVDDAKEKQQVGDISITGLTDRVYLDVNNQLNIHDNGNNRQIIITSEGSSIAVVWNPWIQQSVDMADFGDDEYQNMICVETTNTANDCIKIAAGSAHRMAANYTIVKS
ncbi:MAG: D-hexose-6-phosphate mutarotase [Gammaproteobacteria bacterium]|nr:MAG: D-hexose-6-phosphate mutarotase [Gammaproteobacteria bacterium]